MYSIVALLSGFARSKDRSPLTQQYTRDHDSVWYSSPDLVTSHP